MNPLLPSIAEPPKLGLQVQGTKFLRGGREFRGIGLNHFSLAHNVDIDMLVGGKRDGKADIAEITAWGVPFVRVAFGMFDRSSWVWRWNNKARVWGYLDSIVAECEAKGLGLMPVLVWDLLTFCDLSYARFATHEGPAKLADPNSNVRGLMAEFLTEIVTRYRNSPAIWAWGFVNEATVRTGGEYNKFWAPDGTLFPWLDWGTKPDNVSKYSTSDYLLIDAWNEFTRWAVSLIQQTDGYGRFVSPGSALGNSYSVTCQSANSYAADSKTQWNNFAAGLPWVRYRDASFPVVCSHIYPNAGPDFFSDVQLSYGQLIAAHKAWADQVGKPFILEEFGATQYNPALGLPGDPAVDQGSVSPETERANFEAAVASIVSNDIRLSAAWNYDGNLYGSANWMHGKLRNEPTRRYQLEAISTANAAMAARN